MKDHASAMQLADLEDLIMATCSLAENVTNSAVRRQSSGSFSDEDQHVFGRLCVAALTLRGNIKKIAQVLRSNGYELANSTWLDFDRSMLKIRDLVAHLIDPRSLDSVELPTLEECTRGQQPPQSWFDEDMSGLGGPL